MDYIWIVLGFIVFFVGIAVVFVGIAIDDIRQRKQNRQLRQRLAALDEELGEADAQCVAYIEKIARERQGKACNSKGTCKCG